MKNAWKGLVVGALTGMAGGVVMDLMSGARRSVSGLVGGAVDRAPDAARSAGHHVAEAVRDADLPGKARQAGQHAADAVHDADLPGKARPAGRQVAHSDAARSVRAAADRVADAAG
jgi:hypothetical protein